MRMYLKDMRNKLGMSQIDISQKSKISQPYYCDVEKGSRQQDMTYSMMEKLAAAFGVPLQTIIDAEAAYIRERKDSA